MLGEEVEDDLGALAAVHRRATTGELVALAGEAVEGDVLAQQAHGDEQFIGLIDGAAEVVLAVDDQEGTGDVAHVLDR